MNNEQTEMMHEEILKAAAELLEAYQALEEHEIKCNSQLRFPSDEWTQGQELRRIDLIDAASIAENIFVKTVRST